MFSTSDTIVALATPRGRSGVGIVRISGPDAERIAGILTSRRKALAPRRATFARLADEGEYKAARGVNDQVLITLFPAPHSYTGEHVVEISAHGSPVVLDGIVSRAIAAIESELFDLIAKLEASLDFPDEGYHFIEPDMVRRDLTRVLGRVSELLECASRGRMVREGAQVAIVGAPNVGKSSLFNALLNTSRAIVTAVPGTTRDLLTERADIGGLSMALVDTAGIHDTTDEVEQEGVARARRTADVADLVLVVLDRSREVSDHDRAVLSSTAGRPRIVVFNKSDLPRRAAPMTEGIEISVLTSIGLDQLAHRMGEQLGAATDHRDSPPITNIRHIALVEQARAALARAIGSLDASGGAVPEEFLLTDLQDAAARLQEVTGRRSPEDLRQ